VDQWSFSGLDDARCLSKPVDFGLKLHGEAAFNKSSNQNDKKTKIAITCSAFKHGLGIRHPVTETVLLPIRSHV